jgi:hypothetical protein
MVPCVAQRYCVLQRSRVSNLDKHSGDADLSVASGHCWLGDNVRVAGELSIDCSTLECEQVAKSTLESPPDTLLPYPAA